MCLSSAEVVLVVVTDPLAAVLAAI